VIIAFCNQLIDATVERDAAFLAKWGPNKDDAILADSRHQLLVDEVVGDPRVLMICGGSCQDTLVIAQWMPQEPW